MNRDARPLTGVTPADATVAAFDALGLDYEHAFRGLPALDAALDRLEAALAPGSRVLDVGSGTGRPVAERLVAAGHRVVGVDVSPRMVEIAREQVPGATFEVADVRTWPSPPGSWDAVCAFFPLLTMPRPELDATLARIADWLAPGGRFAFATVPVDADGVDIRFLGQPVRAYSYDTDTLLDRIRAAGLVVDHHEVTTFVPDHPDATPEPHLFLDAHREIGTAIQRLVVSVSDLRRALDLYEGVLGLTRTGESPGLAFLRTADDVEIMLHERPVDRGDAAVAIGFAVQDLTVTVERWLAHGGSVIDPPAPQPWGERMAVVRDVDGHVMTLGERQR